MEVTVKFPLIYIYPLFKFMVRCKPVIVPYFNYVTYCRKNDLLPDDELALFQFCSQHLERIVKTN